MPRQRQREGSEEGAGNPAWECWLAIHQTFRAQNIPYQRSLTKSHSQLTRKRRKNSFFSTLVFQLVRVSDIQCQLNAELAKSRVQCRL